MGWRSFSCALRPVTLVNGRHGKPLYSFGETPEAVWQSADHDTFLASLVDRPRASGSASSAPVFVQAAKGFQSIGRAKQLLRLCLLTRREWETWEAALSFGKTPKSPGQSAEREAILSPVANRPRVSGSASSAPVIVRQQELASELVDESPSRASHRPEARQTANGVSAAPRWPNAAKADGMCNSPEFESGIEAPKLTRLIFQLFSPKNTEVLEEPKTARKKWMIVAAGERRCDTASAPLHDPAVPSWSEGRVETIYSDPSSSNRNSADDEHAKAAGQGTVHSGQAAGNDRKSAVDG